MKITNTTKWQTTQIRAIVSAVMKRSPDHIKRKLIVDQYRKKLHVKVVYNRQVDQGSCSGHAWFHSWSLTLKLPSQVVDRVDMAMVIAHELAHTLGYKHQDMTGVALWNRTGNWRELYCWADELPLEKMAPKRKPKGTDLQLIRYQRLLASQARWETKAKRAKTALTKLHKQRRYYEKQLAAKGVS
jgi:predicted SprT family Zn-dependent metalloprotease